MSNGLFIAGTYPAKRQTTEEKIIMKAIVVTDQGVGLRERRDTDALHHPNADQTNNTPRNAAR